jgi:hypothetical protein
VPDTYIEDPDDEFVYAEDWKECVDDSQPGGGSAFSGTQQEATLSGYVPFNKVRSAYRYFLGHAYADAGAPYKLYRENPARHPVFGNLYAHSASVTPIAVKANTDNENNEPYLESPFDDARGEPMRYGGYEKAVMTVRYKSFGRMRFLPDEDVADYTDEWKRNTRWTSDPAIQSLTAEGSSMLKFREGGGDPHPTADASPFPAPVAELMARAALSMRWERVPGEYVSADPFVFFPTKILSLLGTVNDDAFLGFYKGTMLLTAVKAEEVLFPVTTADAYDVAGGYDLTLVWEWFDPEKGVPASEYRGHRVFPWRKTGKWYWATRENSADELLPLADHLRVFQHWDDPAT